MRRRESDCHCIRRVKKVFVPLSLLPSTSQQDHNAKVPFYVIFTPWISPKSFLAAVKFLCLIPNRQINSQFIRRLFLGNLGHDCRQSDIERLFKVDLQFFAEFDLNLIVIPPYILYSGLWRAEEHQPEGAIWLHRGGRWPFSNHLITDHLIFDELKTHIFFKVETKEDASDAVRKVNGQNFNGGRIRVS